MLFRSHSTFFYAMALFVSFLTVYYSFRLLFVLVFSKVREGHDPTHHESITLKICRAVPLVSLGAISVVVGLRGPKTHLNLEILGTTLFLIAGGASVAFFQFRDPQAAKAKLEDGRGLIFTLLDRKFFMDDLYLFLVKKVGLRLAALLDWFDRKFVNGVMVNQTSYGILNIGRVFSKIQTGLLQDYLSWALVVGVLVIFWLVNSVSGGV